MYNGIMLINVYDEYGFNAYQSEAQVIEADEIKIQYRRCCNCQCKQHDQENVDQEIILFP